MKYLILIILSIFNFQAYAENMPTSEEIFNDLMPLEKNRGLTIEKREKNLTVNFVFVFLWQCHNFTNYVFPH